MHTLLLKDNISPAADIIRAGGLVAVPTETVYGLAANGLDEAAVKKIYEVKGRPAVKPLSLMVHDADEMDKYCLSVPPAARALARRFWPGPLTIVLPATPCVPDIVRAGGATVGLRCPAHPMTLEALNLAGVPFAAPSANPSGAESPKTAESVMEYFSGAIDAVIDGGVCGLGRESTIIDMSAAPYRILRQGALAEADIAGALVDEMTIIGITGTTGAGKTTALEVLKSLGALVIDCDALYHQLLAECAELASCLAEAFPAAYESGALDRRALADIVFSDAAQLDRLNSITHAFITAELQRRLEAWAMSGGRLAAIDAIELFSSGAAARCSCTFAVTADEATRLSRIMARDGLSREAALSRIRAQRPNEYFSAMCDTTLINNGTKEEFADCCFNIFTEVLTK